MHDDLRQVGRISAIDMFIEDHGLLTCFVNMDFNGSSQGFGGYCLDTFNALKSKREGTAAGMDYILRLLKFLRISRLEEAKTMPVYALREKPWGSIIGLERLECDGGGQFLVSDWQTDWFPKEKAR